MVSPPWISIKGPFEALDTSYHTRGALFCANLKFPSLQECSFLILVIGKTGMGMYCFLCYNIFFLVNAVNHLFIRKPAFAIRCFSRKQLRLPSCRAQKKPVPFVQSFMRFLFLLLPGQFAAHCRSGFCGSARQANRQPGSWRPKLRI